MKQQLLGIICIFGFVQGADGGTGQFPEGWDHQDGEEYPE